MIKKENKKYNFKVNGSTNLQSLNSYFKNNKIVNDDTILYNHIHTSLIKKTIFDLGLYFPTIFIQGMMGLITASILSKFFNPQHYGNYIIAFTVYSQLILITGSWIYFAIIRLTPEYLLKGRFSDLALTLMISEILILSLVTMVVLTILLFIKETINPELFSLLIVAVIGAFFLPLVSAMEQFYRITDRTAKYCVIVLFRILIGIGLGSVLAIGLQLGTVGFLGGLVIPNFCLVLWFTFIKRNQLISKIRYNKFSSLILKDAIKFSLPLVVVNAMSTVLIFADRYLINWYLSAYEVAIYGVAYLIVNQGIELVTLVLVRAGDPIAMRSWEEQGSKITYSYLSQLLRYYSLFAMPVLVGLIILGKDLIQLFSTSEYIVGAPVIGYVGLGVVFCGYTQLLNRVFAFNKRTVIPLTNFTVTTVVNILLNVLLIPKFGYISAAWSTLASYLFLFALTVITSRRLVVIKLWELYLLRIVSSSVLMGIIIFWCKSFFQSVIFNITISVVIGIFCYTILLILFGEISVTDIQTISRKIKRLF